MLHNLKVNLYSISYLLHLSDQIDFYVRIRKTILCATGAQTRFFATVNSSAM